jgi:hypothetical protein
VSIKQVFCYFTGERKGDIRKGLSGFGKIQAVIEQEREGRLGILAMTFQVKADPACLAAVVEPVKDNGQDMRCSR